jgi:hypothetical protein
MANDIKKIGEIFGGRFFRVPDYQRGYAWEDKHRQAFWEDLELLQDTPRGSPHYTGLISLEPVARDVAKRYIAPAEEWMLEDRQLCLVVDGQQRLTTFVIFVLELLRRHAEVSPTNDVLTSSTRRSGAEESFIRRPNLIVQGSYGYLFGYAMNADMDNFFRSVIVEDSSVASSGSVTSAYARELARARSFFRSKFQSFDRPAKLGEWYRLAVERLRFNVFEVNSDFDVCLTFEAMNNRGKPLSDLEKLKSRVIYLAGLLAGSEADDAKRDQRLAVYREHINSCWKVVYELLGWNSDKVLDDDKFLNLAWLLRFGKPGESRDQHLFSEVFAPKRVVDAQDWKSIKDFAADLAEAAPCWVLSQNPDEVFALVKVGRLRVSLGEESRKWLRRLARLDTTTFEPLVTAALTHHQNHRLEEADVVRLLRAIEQYVFVVFGLAERRSHTGKNVYFLEASHLYQDANELDRIITRIETEITWRVSADAFVDAVNARDVSEDGFYSWDELRVVLFEYESHLHDARFTRDDNKVRWSEWSAGKLGETIEHIYPQVADDPYWVDRFGSLQPDGQKLLLNALGNLLLLSRAKNSTLQNAAFSSKATQGDHCYRNGSFSENAVAADWEEWTPKAIYERTAALLAFIGERWSVPKWDEASRRMLQRVWAVLPPSEQEACGPPTGIEMDQVGT